MRILSIFVLAGLLAMATATGALADSGGTIHLGPFAGTSPDGGGAKSAFGFSEAGGGSDFWVDAGACGAFCLDASSMAHCSYCLWDSTLRSRAAVIGAGKKKSPASCPAEPMPPYTGF